MFLFSLFGFSFAAAVVNGRYNWLSQEEEDIEEEIETGQADQCNAHLTLRQSVIDEVTRETHQEVYHGKSDDLVCQLAVILVSTLVHLEVANVAHISHLKEWGRDDLQGGIVVEGKDEDSLEQPAIVVGYNEPSGSFAAKLTAIG